MIEPVGGERGWARSKIFYALAGNVIPQKVCDLSESSTNSIP